MSDELKRITEKHDRLAAELKRQSHVISTLQRESADIKKQNKLIYSQNEDLHRRLKHMVAEFDDLRTRYINTHDKLTKLEGRQETLLDRFNKLATKLREKFNL